MKTPLSKGIQNRPPVILVTGHIDHGKSTLLDYIRKTNVTEGEVGGITQRLSAYEVTHKGVDGLEKKITFLDSPGHEAFSGMRSRGAKAADIAILVVSAEDGVKAQTVEALKTIEAQKIPYIVALNKIDKPGANIEKAKASLAENGIYIEGFGGTIPIILISAKTGTGIPELLDMIVLVSDLQELTGDASALGEGVVLESHADPKRGISATLLIKNGVVERGAYVVAENAFAPIRIFEDFMGRQLDTATFSSPIMIAGFSEAPNVGAPFKVFPTKKEAEEESLSHAKAKKFFETKPNVVIKKKGEEGYGEETLEKKMIALIVKADTAGSLEAIEKEITKFKKESISWNIVQRGIGAVTESDVKLASSLKDSLLVSFNVKTEKGASELALRLDFPINSFDIIYKLLEWFGAEIETRKPKFETEEVTGSIKILKFFSKSRDEQVIGGRVQRGIIITGNHVRILRRDFEIGRGKIVQLQQQKDKVKEVGEGTECGLMVESKVEIAPGDMLEAYTIVTK